MPTDQRTELAGIKRFDQLLAYLRDKLGWPIERIEIDELMFDYTPQELGIDEKNTAKIQEIKRLRPLSPRQPWGIFFIKFEPRTLPVVALRRILSQVVLKKRVTARAAGHAAWAADDLLFVSAHGDGEERRMSFAHFSIGEEKEDLPVLKVIDWSDLRTSLHVDEVARQLTTNLVWPTDTGDTEGWRRKWRLAFALRHGQVVKTSRDLSIRLAELARAIRNRIKTALAIETDRGPLTKLMKAFQEALVHDLDADSFADMYAQTIAYGLLAARIADPHKKTADDFAGRMRTNPFLKELMQTFLTIGGRRGRAGGRGIDFDELGVSEVVELLDDANMEAVVRDFGDKNPKEDPVTHFYEGFAREYDPIDKVRRGEFYTPRPVVTYIVRSVDELLRSEFGLADGLADTTTWGEMAKRQKDLRVPHGTSPDEAFVQILDPATGTGTFLVQVIDLIYKTLAEKWKAQGHSEKQIGALWNEYVPKHLLQRLHAYELKMAPYAIAHLKIGLKLYETGYRFDSDERARVYLTNALEPASSKQLELDFLPALAHEAQAVNEIKRKRRFTVVIGNPPYSGLSANMGPWIDGLLKGCLPDGTRTASYYHVNGEPIGERKVWLQDDYVKFTRLSQWLLDQTGRGVHGFITNHGYLDNPTFRGMRWSLMKSFSNIHVLDLHGNLKKKEVAPDRRKDVNVFDIQQGVAIGLFVKQAPTGTQSDLASVHHNEFWGDRESKYDRLLADTSSSMDWQQVEGAEPFYLFEPFDRSEVGDYYNWKAVNEVMPVNVTGIVTARDDFVIDFDRDSLLERVAVFRDASVSDAAIRRKYFSGKGSKKYPPGDSRGWKLPAARKKVRADAKWDKRCASILYRPFDERQIYYVPWMIDWPRIEAMPNMLAGENVAINITRSVEVGSGFTHVFAGRTIIQHHTVSLKEVNYLFPLYLYPGIDKADQSRFTERAPGQSGRRPNLDLGFVNGVERATGLTFASEGVGSSSTAFSPQDALAFIYAVFHSPEYRRRFEPMLKLDFPRVPLPGGLDLFRDLTRVGGELVALHLMVSPKLDRFITTYTGPKNPEVVRVGWSDGTVWLDAAVTKGQPATAGSIGFRGVPEAAWNFNIGGYQVCEKWLKDRKGHRLSKDDLAHYQKIVVALNETIRLMREIDEVIEVHGGWPGAFEKGRKYPERAQEGLGMVAEPADDYGRPR